MANVAHSTLTGSNLHEPKGVAAATSGQVYVANGSGSGIWTSLNETSFVGQVADFALPVPPVGWLECDGTDINTSTYAALYTAQTVQQTGNRTNGSNSISGLADTTYMKAGYYVFGTGIAAGTTITLVNNSTSITLSGNASSTGSSTVVVSPWYLASGTIRLPDLVTVGRFRRSRTSATAVGLVQAGAVEGHTHVVAGTSASGGAHGHSTDSQGTHTHSLTTNGEHTHSVGGNTGFQNDDHTHNVGDAGSYHGGVNGGDFTAIGPGGDRQTSTQLQGHTHFFSATTDNQGNHVHNVSSEGAHTHNITSDPGHAHTFSVTSASTGGAETRPYAVVMMTCIKY